MGCGMSIIEEYLKKGRVGVCMFLVGWRDGGKEGHVNGCMIGCVDGWVRVWMIVYTNIQLCGLDM